MVRITSRYIARCHTCGRRLLLSDDETPASVHGHVVCGRCLKHLDQEAPETFLATWVALSIIAGIAGLLLILL